MKIWRSPKSHGYSVTKRSAPSRMPSNEGPARRRERPVCRRRNPSDDPIVPPRGRAAGHRCAALCEGESAPTPRGGAVRMAVDESPQGRRRLRLPFTTGEPTKERHSHKVRIWNIAGEHENRDCDAACGSCRRSRGRESGQSLVAPDRLAVTPATFPTDTSGVRSRRQAEHVTDATA